MQNDFDAGRAKLAKQKMESGALLSQAELQTFLGLSASTVDRLPIPSIRIGRSKRYDPRDINRMVDACREPIAA